MVELLSLVIALVALGLSTVLPAIAALPSALRLIMPMVIGVLTYAISVFVLSRMKGKDR